MSRFESLGTTQRVIAAIESGERVGLTVDGRPVADIFRVRSEASGAGAMEAIIAATALTHGLDVWTQDGDFDVLAQLARDLRVHRT